VQVRRYVGEIVSLQEQYIFRIGIRPAFSNSPALIRTLDAARRPRGSPAPPFESLSLAQMVKGANVYTFAPATAEGEGVSVVTQPVHLVEILLRSTHKICSQGLRIPTQAKCFACSPSAQENNRPKAVFSTSGGRGIRTLEELTPLAVFKTAAFNHSAIPPLRYS